jgi:hypothetical protein
MKSQKQALNPLKSDKVNRETIIHPKGSTSAFHLWQYGSFAQYHVWDDDPSPELMLFSPVLAVAWNVNQRVRYEFALVMQNGSGRGDLLFAQLHNPEQVLRINNKDRSSYLYFLQEMLLNGGHRGALSWDAAPKLACEYKDTILEAATNLQLNASGYSFTYGWYTSTFCAFAIDNKNLGSAIVGDGSIVTKMLKGWLAPNQASKPKTQRNVPPKLRRSILERDGYQCVDCGRSPRNDPSCVLHVDHRIAVAKGGSNRPSNLQTLCDWCNIGKHTDPDWKLKAAKL